MKLGTNKARLRNNLIMFGYLEKTANKITVMLYTLKELYGSHVDFSVESASYPPIESHIRSKLIYFSGLFPDTSKTTYVFTVFNQGAGVTDDGNTWYIGDFQGDTNEDSWLEEVKGAVDYYSSSYY